MAEFAISSYKVFLMHSADGSAYTKLIDIKDYPDLGGEPERLDATTLSHGSRVYIPGIQDSQAMTFTANYTPEDYQKIKALEGKQQSFAVWMGGSGTGEELEPTGEHGKFEFKGQISVYATGKGVNEVVDMTLSISRSSDVTFKTA